LAPTDPAIDVEHLARMTLGQQALEQEVLRLFGQQAEALLARMQNSPPAARVTFAHTLKGSACGIGAWRVAAAADSVESGHADQDGNVTLGRLIAAVDEVRAEVAELLRMRASRPSGRSAERSKQ
jgi:hypothetical protein